MYDFLSVCFSVFLYVYPCICLSLCLSVYLSVCLYVCLSDTLNQPIRCKKKKLLFFYKIFVLINLWKTNKNCLHSLNRVAPQDCSAGQFSMAKSTSCTQCLAGYACPNTATITSCAPGTYSIGLL